MKPTDFPEYALAERPVLESPTVQSTPSSTAISIRNILRRTKNIGRTLLKKWLLILIATLVGGGIGWFLDEQNYEPPQYLARYMFNLETQSGGGNMNDFASFLNMGGGAADNGLFSGENFYILFQSRPLVEKALLRKMTVRGHHVLLANYYILTSGIRTEEWKESKVYKNFLFDPNKPRSLYTRREVSALNQLREKVKSKVALGQPNKKSSFIEFGIGTPSESLSMLLSESMMEAVKEFYQTNKTRKTLEVLDLARKRRDSLRAALYSNESQMARYLDQNAGLIVAAPQVQQQRLSRNATLAGSMYTDALRNVESIQASLIRETPLVTIIDSPVLPLSVEFYPGRSKKFGLFLGAFLGIAFVLLRRTYLDIMKE